MNKKQLKGLQAFLREGIWRVTDDEVSRPRGILYDAIKIATLSVREFMQDRILNKASALTYSTLLSIIPILAILFAIARGFGFSNLLENQFRSGLEGQNLAAETILGLIDSYLIHAKSGVFIGVGLIMLFWTILSLTDNIERTFNYIWQVKKPRTLYRKLTDYFSILLLLPLLFVVSSGLSIFMATMVKNMEGFVLLAPLMKFLLRLTPFILTAAMFTGLFIFMPNTKVKFRYAVIPGIFSGVAFQAFQYLYIGSQLWVSGYNAIYGSFAAIPMFLLWTQVSWSICLYGAELCYVAQNLQNYSFGKETEHISRRYHDFLCILILSFICKQFEQGNQPYTADQLSSAYKIPIRLTRKILYELQDIHLIYETPVGTDGESIAYLPATDIHRMNVAMLLNRLDTAGTEAFKIDHERYKGPWEALSNARKDYYRSASEILLKDL